MELSIIQNTCQVSHNRRSDMTEHFVKEFKISVIPGKSAAGTIDPTEYLQNCLMSKGSFVHYHNRWHPQMKKKTQAQRVPR